MGHTMLNFTATAYEAAKHPFGEAPETKNEVIGKTEFEALNVNAAQAYIDTQVFSEGRAATFGGFEPKSPSGTPFEWEAGSEAGTYRRCYTAASNRDYRRTIVIGQKPTTEAAVEVETATPRTRQPKPPKI